MAATNGKVCVTILSTLILGIALSAEQASAGFGFGFGNSGGGKSLGTFRSGNGYGSSTSRVPQTNWLEFGSKIAEGIIESGRRNRRIDDYERYPRDNRHRNYYYEDDTRPVLRVPQEKKVTVKPNKVVKPPVKPKSNSGFALKATPVSFAQLNAWKRQTQQENAELIDELAENLPSDSRLANEISGLMGPYTVDEKNRILDAIKNGDTAGLQFLLKDGDKNSAAGLMQHAQAFGALSQFEAEVNAGTASSSDVTKLLNSLAPYYPPTDRHEAEMVVLDLMDNNELTSILNTAAPGNGIIPNGGNSQIVWVSGLAPGTVISLGNGAVMVGYDGPQGSIEITEGSALGAAGLPVVVGDPVPETEAAEVTSGVVLLNGGMNKVNYVVNNTRFSMQPDYTQALPEGTKWKIRFDRGKGDTASYTLTSGTYKFTPVDDGWELYKHSSKVTIDNSDNPFTFSYVVNNKRESLAPGKSRVHTSDYPLLVRFDDGQGTEKRKKISSDFVRVAVADDNSLDLYEQDSIAPPTLGPTESVRSASSLAQEWTRRPGRSTGRFSRTSSRTSASSPVVNLFGK